MLNILIFGITLYMIVLSKERSNFIIILCHIQVHLSGNYIPTVISSPIIQACLPWWLPFLQHTLRQCYNYLGIPSFMAEILLFDSVFHDRVTPVSVLTLKPPLGVIETIPLKSQASLIVEIYI